MTLFDRYIAVDWSAANTPRTDKDSIWIGEFGPTGPLASINPATRTEAMLILTERLRAARARGERVMAGFDFVFGYPRGAARAIAGKASWATLWNAISLTVEDLPDNRSNRFEVASSFNRILDQHHFWGHPPHHVYPDLQPTRPLHGYPYIPERRMAEARASGPQSVWKLTGAGSVGSQSLLGIPRLEQLRRLFPEAAIWPFETDFEHNLAPLSIVEIYPSLFPLAGNVLPRDREQVETCVRRFADLDAAGLLAQFLSAPTALTPEERRIAIEEEGWIAGVGHEALLTAKTPRRIAYLRDPDAIYAQSFATIRAEADLRGLGADMQDVAIRMIHACGMVEIAAHIRATEDVVEKAQFALVERAPILCDCEAVRSGIIAKYLHGNDLVVTLNDPAVPDLAARLGTTRSAAAVELWRDRLAGAIVVIGNAPTALFHLLEMLDAGAPKPAAIIATPVGFVGAEEAKAELDLDTRGVPFITLLGRRGGSAIASAALNAIAKGIAP
jgi:precorrin-8X/cobalt-precorrin-8 methylmutase